MIGIYKIENLLNHKVYIGQSKYIEKRWKNHQITAFNSNDKGYDYPLYRAIRKYGIENFSFQVLEECSPEQLNEKEKYYISSYNSFFEGYNQTMGGDGSSNGQLKDQVIGVIKDLETTNMYHHEIAKKWNLSVEMVQGINTGRYWKHNRIYPIQSLEQRKIKPRKQYFCVDCHKLISYGATRCQKCDNIFRAKNHSIPSSREELKKLIRTESFLAIGEKYGVTDNAVRRWCDKYGLPRRKKDIKKISDQDWIKI